AYGNVTATPELAANTVTVYINDNYAQPVTPTTIDTVYGDRLIDVIFHTAKQGMYLRAQTTQSGIADYTTPTFTTYAGPAYGLQLIVPGLTVVEGSGRTIGAFSNWYNGVTGIPLSQYTTNPFPVTVQSADIFGNFAVGAANTVRVYTSASTYINPYPQSFPFGGVDFVGTLGDASPGRVTLTAYYSVTAAKDVELKPQDMSPAGPSNLERVWISYPTVPIVLSGDLRFQIIVNGVDYGIDGTNSVTAVVYPDTFAMTVNIVDAVSGNPVYGVNDMFRLVPVLASNINTTANGTLAVPPGGTGSVINGVFTTILQSYDRAERIRIRVENPNPGAGGVQTGPRWSCVIDFSANSLAANMTAVAVPSSIGSGQVSQIRALVVDSSGNSVIGREVEFEFLAAHPSSTGTGDFGLVSGSPVLVTRAVTNSQGIATAYFT
ncbi:MAG TPA: hypothetical protein P5511_08745, partial [Candidatus Goldiibacteriota bacterium]|nr:hypothetical protein [Candidatus Goldiibacteriota bacterium]